MNDHESASPESQTPISHQGDLYKLAQQTDARTALMFSIRLKAYESLKDLILGREPELSDHEKITRLDEALISLEQLAISGVGYEMTDRLAGRGDNG